SAFNKLPLASTIGEVNRVLFVPFRDDEHPTSVNFIRILVAGHGQRADLKLIEYFLPIKTARKSALLRDHLVVLEDLIMNRPDVRLEQFDKLIRLPEHLVVWRCLVTDTHL